MCTTSEIPQYYHNSFDIKEESDGHDTITFEDYKFTEHYPSDFIKEEPVDYYEIVELTNVIDIHPNERNSKDEGDEWRKETECCEQMHLDGDDSCKKEYYETKIDGLDCESQYNSHFEPNIYTIKAENGIKPEPVDDSTIKSQIFSIEDWKSFIIHDHSYYQASDAPILSKFDSDDDEEILQEDDEVESTFKSKYEQYENAKIVKLIKNSSKLQTSIRESRKMNSEDSDSDQSILNHTNSVSDDSMDEDEDGIQYKEVSPTKLNSLVESGSDFENSEDDHSCYTKNNGSDFEIQLKYRQSPPKYEPSSSKNAEKLVIDKKIDEKMNKSANSSRVSCDIRINNAMDLKKCFENSSKKLVKNNKKFMKSENKNSNILKNLLTKSQDLGRSSRDLSEMIANLPKISKNSSNPSTNLSKSTTNSHQISTNSSKLPIHAQTQSDIVDLLTDSSNSDSDSETQKYSQNPKISTKPNQSMKCPECPMTFHDTLRLNRHKRTHQSPQFQCKNCLRKFKRKSMLKKHFCDIKCLKCPDICTCQMENSKDCIICQKINFRYFVDYKEHMMTNHNEIVYCKICEKNNYTLFKHKQLKHDVVRSYRCTECTSILKSKEQLEYHMEIHAKNFSCSKCSKVFTRRYLLRQHELTHDNPQQFHCEICNKNFQRKFCLENHKKVIHGDKKKEEKYLKQHRGMNGEKSTGWIECDKCPALFRNEQSHKRHLGQAH
ncbi:zinc finger protein 816-like [Chironomus tepperi]|uniref:zinc finger protein 816-like n=1 Tax=Chironomus tepperi TaxID=113505 RepID=UPI00391EE38C